MSGSLRPPSELGFSSFSSRAPAEPAAAGALTSLAAMTSPELVDAFRATVLALFDRASLDAPLFLPLAEALVAEDAAGAFGHAGRWRPAPAAFDAAAPLAEGAEVRATAAGMTVLFAGSSGRIDWSAAPPAPAPASAEKT